MLNRIGILLVVLAFFRCALVEADEQTVDITQMIWVSAHSFSMGSNQHYIEENQSREVSVSGFWIDKYEVSNEQFAEFVSSTQYVTVAERPIDKNRYPNASASALASGSFIFHIEKHSVSRSLYDWWKFVPGANWRHPHGPKSSIEGLENHPVVHIAYEDALAYAKWAGKQLPSEAQWESAAQPLAQTKSKDSQYFANTWQGQFPISNTREDGFVGTAPVGSFPANSRGVYDMLGNVWEWTSDWYLPHHLQSRILDPKGPPEAESYSPLHPNQKVRVIKGGSYLCSPSHCNRSRASARQPQEIGTSTSHVGFRTVYSRRDLKIP